MAEDKYNNEDPEENNDHFDDDEDFGLPDLEYDELDDEDGSDEPMDEESFEDELEEVVPEEEPVVEEEPVAEDTPEPVGEDMLDEDFNDIDLGDFDDSDTEDWEKELEKELEEELKSDGDAGGFYEEESFDEFDSELSTSDDNAEVATSVFGSDDDSDFGGELEYTEESSDGADTPPTSTNTYYQESNGGNKSKFVRTVVIGTLALAVVAFGFLIAWNILGSDDTPTTTKKKVVAKKETPAQKAPEKKPEPKKEEPKKEEPKKVEPKKEEPKKEVAKKPEPKPQPKPVQKAAGEITSVTGRTGKTYIVIGSFFDSDLAQDFARKLSEDSRSPIVISPFGESKFYRVAIAEFANFADAKASLETYKSEFGQDIWPLKY